MIAIRPEMSGDEPVIHALTTNAFAAALHSDGTESDIIDRLRDDGDLAISLVADDAGIIGHIAFSPVAFGDATAGWYGLGPISVTPARQRTGIGGQLIRAGLERLMDIGAAGCVVLGDPNYYGRFGFRHDPAIAFEGPPAQYFQVLVLAGPLASGEARYAPAFY